MFDSAQRCQDMEVLMDSHSQNVREITSKCFFDEAYLHNA